MPFQELSVHDNLSFNRYMVECEYKGAVVLQIASISFNRYMVECEFIVHLRHLQKHLVLIDTWWNVNFDILCLARSIITVLIDTWWNVNMWEWEENAGCLLF